MPDPTPDPTPDEPTPARPASDDEPTVARSSAQDEPTAARPAHDDEPTAVHPSGGGTGGAGGGPGGPSGSGDGPSGGGPERGLLRSSTDRVLFGVCGGIGERYGVEPLLIRIAFVVAVFFGGSGLLFYLAAAILVPSGAAPETVRTVPALPRS